MADPVSWFVVERGWEVVGPDGAKLGTVEETVGDSSRDIFDGLTVATGLIARPKYVASELVDEIVEGQVRLSVDKAGFDELEGHEEPPASAQIRPE